MLIAGIAEELTADEPDAASPSRASLEKAIASAGPPPPMAHRTLQIPVPSPHGSETGNILDSSSIRATPRWSWIAGAAAIALLAVGIMALSFGSSEDSVAGGQDARSNSPEEPEHELAQHETVRAAPLATAATVRVPPVSAAAGAPGGSEGEALVPPPLPEIPEDLLAAEATASAEESSAESASAAGSGPNETTKSAAASPRSTKRARRAGNRSASSTAPAAPAAAPAAPASPTPASSADLLQEARQALKQGDASTAYRLAFRSNSKKSSRSALQLMAKAACRMKSRDKAKAAFDRLPVTDRAGLRSECRGYGVRLGL